MVADRARQHGNLRTSASAVEVDREAEFVFADLHRLEQVLTNLAVNGVKFTPPGGHGQPATPEQRRMTPFTSWSPDTGIGILPEQQAHTSSSRSTKARACSMVGYPRAPVWG